VRAPTEDPFLRAMRTFEQRYVRGTVLGSRPEVSVVEVTPDGRDGRFAPVFRDARYRYLEVPVQLDRARHGAARSRLPFDDVTVDIVVAGDAFDRRAGDALFAESVRVAKPNGFVVMVAPVPASRGSGRGAVRPLDADALRSMARAATTRLLDAWEEHAGERSVCVGVFSRTAIAPRRPDAVAAASRRSAAVATPDDADATIPDATGTPDEERPRGDAPYLEVLRRIHHVLQPDVYLEIGVRTGASLALATRTAIGVDPFPELSRPLGPATTVVPTTSDAFFDSVAPRFLRRPPALAFIDGLHLFENVLRDFINVERHAASATLVVVDDCFPAHPAQAERRRRTRAWTGDVWKLYRCLRERRPGLFLQPVDASPSGLLLISGLDPRDRTLHDAYDEIVAEAAAGPSGPPDWIVSRRDAIPAGSPSVDRIAATLRAAWHTSAAGPDLVAALRASVRSAQLAGAPR
jgi:SAM-dependent methyltransferase